MYQTVLMGSNIALKLYQRQDKIAGQALLLVKSWEDRLTVNRSARGGRVSEIAAVNAAAGHRPVRVTPEVFALLQQARRVSLYRGSCFNFAIGPIVKAWNIGFAQANVPPPTKIAALLPLCDPRAVILDSADCSVFLPQCGMALDLGAIAKGFIADCVKNFLQKSGVKTALINLGGNIHSLGAPKTADKADEAGARQQNWLVGLQKPFGGRHDLLGVIHMANKSVVTSGIYERYFIGGGPQEPGAGRAYAAALAAALPAEAGPGRIKAEKAAKEAAATARKPGCNSSKAAALVAGEPPAGAAAKTIITRAENAPPALPKYDAGLERMIAAGQAASEAPQAAPPMAAAPGRPPPAGEQQPDSGKTAFYHHIFDPRTGCPLHNDLLSVTVISDKSVDGEIGTSLLYGFGLSKALDFCRSGQALDSLLYAIKGSGSAGEPEAALSGAEAIFVTKDRRIIIPQARSFRFELRDNSYQLAEGVAAA